MVEYRELDDVDAMRRATLARIRDAAAAKYPIENEKYILELSDLKYDREEPYSLNDQKEAILHGKSLRHKLNGVWRLRDKATGKVVDEKKTVVAHVPMITHRGTMIYNGNEYTSSSQLRLRSGPYSRRKDNGGFETHFNVLPGSGRAFRVHLEPETGVFKMQVGQSHLPMYPILRAIGMTDDKLERYWGKDLLAANRVNDASVIQKAYERFVGDKQPDEAPEVGLKRAFNGFKLDDEIVESNLGSYLSPLNSPAAAGQGTLTNPHPIG